MNNPNNTYSLYDLRVEVIASTDGIPMVCKHKVGDSFTITDEDRSQMMTGLECKDVHLQ